jgi:hypothetical protein
VSAQDTEAIRAANDAVFKALRAHAQRRRQQRALVCVEPEEVLDVLADRDRLVARLEAAERALRELADSVYENELLRMRATPELREAYGDEWPLRLVDATARVNVAEACARAALAAAAPGETTEPK